MLSELVLLLMAVLCTAAKTQEFFNRSDCPPANEGDTAKITFYSSRQKDISSQDLLFFLRKDEGPDILRCIQAARASEADCDESDNGVKTKGLKGGKLTLVISNVTTDMLGSYALHVLSSEKSYYPSVCNLTILENDGGRTDNEEAGQEAYLIPGVVAGLVAFACILLCLTYFIWRRRRQRREHRCREKQNVEWLGRDSTDLTIIAMNGTHYTSNTEERERTTLLLSEDTDESLRVVHEKHEKTTVSDNNTNGTHNKSTPEERECTALLPSADTDENVKVVHEKDNEKTTVSDNNTGYIDWEITPSEERELLMRHGPGSFFIKRSKFDSLVNVLTVNCDGIFKYFMITKEGSNIVFRPEETSFKSLSDLVEHYTQNPIRTAEDRMYCKLKYPCTRNLEKENSEKHENHQTGKPPSPSAYPEQQKEPFTSTQGADSEKNSEKHENHQTGKPPSPSAYSEQQEEPFTSTQGADSEKLVGKKMRRKEEIKLLRSCGQGSFRIKRNKRAQANYTLAVFWNSKVIYFEITPHNSKFRFVETGKDFESLSDLVAHYTKHDIRVSNGTLYCKLTTPCTSGPDSD